MTALDKRFYTVSVRHRNMQQRMTNVWDFMTVKYCLKVFPDKNLIHFNTSYRPYSLIVHHIGSHVILSIVLKSLIFIITSKNTFFPNVPEKRVIKKNMQNHIQSQNYSENTIFGFQNQHSTIHQINHRTTKSPRYYRQILLHHNFPLCHTGV